MKHWMVLAALTLIVLPVAWWPARGKPTPPLTQPTGYIDVVRLIQPATRSAKWRIALHLSNPNNREGRLEKIEVNFWFWEPETEKRWLYLGKLDEKTIEWKAVPEASKDKDKAVVPPLGNVPLLLSGVADAWDAELLYNMLGPWAVASIRVKGEATISIDGKYFSVPLEAEPKIPWGRLF